MSGLNLKRVFAINDLSGFGKCALSIAIPVISACGVEVCPIPTAILSTNTKFEGFAINDLTASMPPYINHWYKIGLKTDAIYTGFLGSIHQIETVSKIIDDFKPSITVIDPIMGDNGEIYKTFTPQICQAMKKTVSKADVVTPNLTEACILSGCAYDNADLSPPGIKAIAAKIAALGAKHVIVKGIERGGKIYNCLFNGEGYFEYEYDLLPYKMFGTGDLFASVFTGKLLTGNSIEQSIHLASEFVSFIMRQSVKFEGYENRGLCFEPYLHLLREPSL